MCSRLTYVKGSSATGLLTLHLGDLTVKDNSTINATASNSTISGNVTATNVSNHVTGLDFRATHYKCAAVNETEWIISASRPHPLSISVLTLENLNVSVSGVKRLNNSKQFIGNNATFNL